MYFDIKNDIFPATFSLGPCHLYTSVLFFYAVYIGSVFLSGITICFINYSHQIKIDHLQPVTCFIYFFVTAISYHFPLLFYVTVLCID